jgi:hypothetical protein
VLALSFQGRSASIPILDYSRTGRYLNEEVVILRELFVKRKPFSGVRSFPSLCLFFLGRERSEGKDPISPSSPGGVATFPHWVPHPTS